MRTLIADRQYPQVRVHETGAPVTLVPEDGTLRELDRVRVERAPAAVA